MKSLLRKIRGKKNEQEQNRRWTYDERGLSGPAPVPQNQPLRSSLVAAQNLDTGGNQAAGLSGSSTLPLFLNATTPPPGVMNMFIDSVVLSSSLANTNPFPVGPVALCQTCYNLDPHQGPRDGNAGELMRSWARAEYNIPAGTPVARVTLDEPKQILEESINRGCVYCFIVQTALDAMQPTWKTERWHVNLCLAPGIPVIVRLQPGKTSTIPFELENVLGTWSRPMQYTLTSFVLPTPGADPGMIPPEIDIEIYRPQLRPDQITEHDIIYSPFLEHIATAEEIQTHVGDQRCFDFITERVANCMEKHKCGVDRREPPVLPDRVIWVGAKDTSRIRLLEPKPGSRAKYIALSYCWGERNSDTYLTDTSTYAARKAHIMYTDLPPLFQDVVRCARTLRIEYIWADRLCIIQGDDNDWKRQSVKMGEVYGNATLTIAAASAASENDHILVARDPKWSRKDLKIDIGGMGSLKVCYRRRTHLLGREDKGGDYGKVSTRGWIWQERLLSKRTIFYTPSALKFECHDHSVWEGYNRGAVTSPSWSAQLEGITPHSWMALVEEYTSRDMSFPKDRLVAMESVMKRIQSNKGWVPFYGMWANRLAENMGWKPKQLEIGGGTHPCRMNPGHFAPTWSWASVNGPISYESVKNYFEEYPMSYSLRLGKDIDFATGRIKVQGWSTYVKLSCRIEQDRDESREGSRGQVKLRYHYEIPDAYKDEGPNPITAQPVTADVVLKPWSCKIQGEDTTGIIRVPHGETPPAESWSAYCFCLLVGDRKSGTSLLLFLGESEREPGAKERIGMAVAGHECLILQRFWERTVEIV